MPTTGASSAAPAAERADAFIAEPPRINPLLRLGIWAIERGFKQRFVPGRLIAWSPRTAVQWVLVPGGRPGRILGKRIPTLVAITAAYTAGSPYCVAVNVDRKPSGLSAAELQVIRTGADVSQVRSFTPRERLAVRYARLISATPLNFPQDFMAELTKAFTEKQIVVMAAIAASINYNARLIEALGTPAPAFGARQSGGR